MADYDISALGDKVLRTLWYTSGGSPRLHNVKALLPAISEQEPRLERERLVAELEALSKNRLVEARRTRIGIIMAKLTQEGVTYIHSNQPGIPSFYARNINALSVAELKIFLNELNGRLAGSVVGSRDFNLTKEEVGPSEICSLRTCFFDDQAYRDLVYRDRFARGIRYYCA